jgi:hypothetical protein
VTEVDPLSPEASDPFFVPDRTSEAVAFIGAAALAGLIPVAPFFVPLSIDDMGLLLGMALFVALLVYRGLQARTHRLTRMRKVANFQAGLLRQRENSTSA